MKFVVCVSREDCGDISTDDLTLGRLYEVLEPADSPGLGCRCCHRYRMKEKK